MTPAGIRNETLKSALLDLAGQPPSASAVTAGPVPAGNGCPAGRCVILRGAEIADGAVIAAGALLAGDVPPRALAAGAPAVPEKLRGRLAAIGALRSLNRRPRMTAVSRNREDRLKSAFTRGVHRCRS